MDSSLPIYSIHRDTLVESSSQLPAFYLDLKTRNPLVFQRFPVLEFPCIPHIGVYGDDYWPSPLYGVIDIPFSDKLDLPLAMKQSLEIWETQNLEFRIVFHGLPLFGECQKFSCSNLDEINVMYHAWAFPNHEVGDEASTVEKLEAGCFEPIGVQGVHLNLVDGGLAINQIKTDYTIVIHDLSFSPANLMLQVTHSHPLVSFFTLAHLPNPSLKKTVGQLHVFAVTDEMDDALKACVNKSNTLGDLVHHLALIDPGKEVSTQIAKLLNSVPLS